VLADLMQWATTVVRLRRDKGGEWVADQFATFPAEFLIFSPHVQTLVFDDRTRGERKEYAVRRDGDTVTVEDNGSTVSWKVFRTTHRPSPDAREDGGYSASRDKLAVHWAVSKPKLGRLWAFFPTKEIVTASGIFNAPWKLTDDRATIMAGPFNEELLDEAAELFLSNLGKVVDDDDPGQILELFPGREKEKRGLADLELITKIYGKSPSHAVLPDQNGVLQLASSMVMHPQDLPMAALKTWSKARTRPANWCHPSVESPGEGTTRRAKATRLLTVGSGRTASFSEWFVALIDNEDPVESSRRMIYVSEKIVDGKGEKVEAYKLELCRIPFVLSADGEMVAPSPGAIFLPAGDGTKADVKLIHPDLAENEFVVAALRKLGVEEVSDESLLDAQIHDAKDGRPGSDWTRIWERARNCSRDLLPALLAKHQIDEDDVSVRTLAGHWARLGGVLRIGRVLKESELADDDRSVALDEDWHAKDIDVLQALGATEGPVEKGGSTDEPWGERYLDAARATYKQRCQGTKPADDSIEIDGLGVFAGPATPLLELSPIPTARFLAAAFERTNHLRPIELSHRTKKNMPIVQFPHPLVWLLSESGVVLTSLGVVPLNLAVAPALAGLRRILPVVELPDIVVEQLGLARSLVDLSDQQWELVDKAIAKLDDMDQVMDVYRAIVDFSPTPKQVRALVRGTLGDHEAGDVAVAATDHEARLLRESGTPHLVCTDEGLRARLVERWGLKSAVDLIGSELHAVPDGPAEAIGDLFPMLTALASDEQLAVRIQRCTELRRDWFTESGRISDALRVERGEGILYVADIQDDRDLLELLNDALELGLDADAIGDVVENAAAQATADLMARMRKAPDDASRLLMVVESDALRQRLPRELIEAYADMNGDPDPHALAELALAALGLEALSKLAPYLREKGLQVPTTWAGSRRAIQFVRELGFDRGYAGFKSDDRSETLEVEGPIELPELHDYQRKAADAIHDLMADGGGLRGLLSLPTGAGKTRVTVQAIVEAMAPEDGFPSPVLWIAQTSELCEQAVQSWAEVWRAMGPARPVRLSRLWRSNKAEPVDEGDQVVIATIAKLNSIAGKPQYDWLTQATCVVVDEAHASTERSYTKVLKWLGMGGGKERVPLIGLSATPFRNASESENQQLAARYGRRRLDFGAFGDEQPTTKRLQEMGILAEVDHQVLDGASVNLSDADIAYLEEFGRLPAAVLNKLGEDVGRNRRLLDSLLSQSEDWPILVFAASVAHAQTMAALVTKAGRPAASISSETNPSVRHYVVDRFKRGEIKVLTNYGVLTQGFDAPAVRALYIARPTYSANRYQQMVGRGLRGRLNGGKERCLVVNVADNLKRYGGELAFKEFDYLWSA
jgi:superfamily II DNA or RNA helicase